MRFGRDGGYEPKSTGGRRALLAVVVVGTPIMVGFLIWIAVTG